MNRSARNLLFLLFSLVPILAASDEQQKAHKLLNKVTAMAIDPAGRRAVSLAMSQELSVDRKELAQRRRALNVSYGDLFIAYELAKSGTKIDDTAAKLKIGKTVWLAADEQHADWKQVANDARKLSSRVDSDLLRYFAKEKSEVERDRVDGYDPMMDSVKADGDVSREDIEDAQDRYTFLHDHAGAVPGSTLDVSTERAARQTRPDPIRSAGPSPH